MAERSGVVSGPPQPHGPAPTAVSNGAAEAPCVYTVSVRNLCVFAAKAGDLDLRFTPSPTAQQGRQGHQLVGQRRGPDHETEVSLSGRFHGLQVRGRADGFDPHGHVLEEVKTFRGSVEAIAPQHQELHWAQLKVYGWLMCQSRGFTSLTLSLVYFDVHEQAEFPINQVFQADVLQSFFDGLCTTFLAWAEKELVHRQRRDTALSTLGFPQLPFRPGQRELAAAVYRACVQSHTLLAQAPTGIGKTMGCVYPALRATPERGTDKVFFLTAKTPGRQVALDALAQLRGGAAQSDAALPLRVIELVAKDKACEHRDKACHGASCPLARGFYDRLAGARQAAAEVAWLDQRALRDVALHHGICPYYLGHEMVRWSDVVVADYNYYFDRSAMLHALMLDGNWRVTVLVDEAHNLVPRGSAMYSADLTHAETVAVRGQAPASLRAGIDVLLDQWQVLHERQVRADAPSPWNLLDCVPEPWLRALNKLNLALGEHVNTTAQDSSSTVLPFYFRTLALAMLADAHGPHSLCEYDQLDADPLMAQSATTQPAQSAQVPLGGDGFTDPIAADGRITLRNIVPGHFLAPRLQSADAMVLFSATLQPSDYYLSLLGLPENTRHIDVPSPFRPEQLAVRVVPVSTRRDARADSLDTLVHAVAGQYRLSRGNYLAFFSSFDYLEQACARLRALCPDIPVWAQARQMDENARRGFLAQFDHAGHGIGFAVLGGVFGEGVDLPGSRLIGAFVATLGLPQFDPVNEAIRQRMQDRFGKGYEYTYLYPGLQKVVQAAGRVIRTETDTGCVVLLDDRYREPRYRALLPAWWQIMLP